MEKQQNEKDKYPQGYSLSVEEESDQKGKPLLDIPIVAANIAGVAYALDESRKENARIDAAADKASAYLDARIAETGKESDRVRRLMIKHGGWYDTGDGRVRHRNYSKLLNEVLHEAGEEPFVSRKGLRGVIESVGVGAIVYIGMNWLQKALGGNKNPVETAEKSDRDVSR